MFSGGRYVKYKVIYVHVYALGGLKVRNFHFLKTSKAGPDKIGAMCGHTVLKCDFKEWKISFSRETYDILHEQCSKQLPPLGPHFQFHMFRSIIIQDSFLPVVHHKTDYSRVCMLF